MKIKPKDGHLVAEIECDDTLLKEKLKLLLDFKAALFKSVNNKFISESFCLAINSAVNDSDIVLSNFTDTTSAINSEKLLCALDFDLAKFIDKWIIAMRANDSDGCGFVHDEV